MLEFCEGGPKAKPDLRVMMGGNHYEDAPSRCRAMAWHYSLSWLTSPAGGFRVVKERR